MRGHALVDDDAQGGRSEELGEPDREEAHEELAREEAPHEAAGTWQKGSLRAAWRADEKAGFLKELKSATFAAGRRFLW